MDCKTLKRVNLTNAFPKEIKDSLVCFTLINSRVVDEAPDVVTCNKNGYMYEVKNKKIVRCLNLEDNPLTVSCYYIKEQNKLVTFYTVLTKSKKLLIIRTTNKQLKVVKEYYEVKSFDVYDFQGSGLPQIKIYFMDKPESFIYDFPIELQFKEKISTPEDTPFLCGLSEELEDLNKFIDGLQEEYSLLKKVCFSKNKLENSTKVSVNSSSVSSNNLAENQFVLQGKWFRVFGGVLVLGMTLRNIGRKITEGLDVIINHEKIQNYAFAFFQPTWDITQYLFSATQFDSAVDVGEEICVTASFAIPEFYTESDLSIDCYVVPKDIKDGFIKVTFEINVCDIALQNAVDLEERFTGEDLLAILVVKEATHLKIQTEDFDDDTMEPLLTKSLGFKSIKTVKDKLFYCTSTYLKEVFVGLQHVAKNPSVWKMVVYTSQDQQIYFLVNALYDLLPENSAILYDGNTD